MPKSNQPHWTAYIEFREYIDFCVWVLEVDGLHVPPFDQHPEGNKSLQAKGLDVSSWKAWFDKVVTFQDMRLRRFYSLAPKPAFEDSVQDLIDQGIEELGSTLLAERGLDLTGLAPLMSSAWDVEEFRYRQAVSEVGEPPVNLDVYTPLDLWTGEISVKEKLAELWQEYQRISEQRKSPVFEYEERIASSEELKQKALKIWEDLEAYQANLTGLMIYQVNYPAPVEYLLPPVSIVLSFKNGFKDSDALHDCILSATQKLVEIVN